MPVVERIAGWSARHRKTAVLGWLVLVAAVFVGGSMISSTKVQQYDAGQSGQAERTLNRLNVKFQPAENVLIQARSPGAAFAGDPELRNATAQVVAALRGLPGSAGGDPLAAQPGRRVADLRQRAQRACHVQCPGELGQRGPDRRS
jgi:RND superfamily putative drug exporter